MNTIRRKDFIFLLFPKLRVLCCKPSKKTKMKFPTKLMIGCGVAFVFIILGAFIGFPKMLKGKIKKMVTLQQGSDIRGMFLKVPFGLEFRVYMFNVTNPMDVQTGQLPHVQEVGPFCYEEWKEKLEVQDNEEDDTMYYKAKDTFLPKMWDGCLTGDEVVTIPHPLIVGMVNTVLIQKPAMLTLINKAVNSIYSNPTSIFLTAKVRDILFDGVIINCGVKDFAGKAVCTQLKTEATDLKHVSEDELSFSLMGPKNATPGKRFKVYRGVKVSRDIGRVIEYDEKKEMTTWPTKKCNQFMGTDGTVFPPLLAKEEGITSFAPDLCRSIVAGFKEKTKYDGIPVNLYTATLGDMSKNADEKCYCLTPETCLKKGMMDLYKCAGVPIYASFPHFYDCDDSYVKGVVGLSPSEEKHGIEIYFEQMTGGPVSARKRLQFSMPIEPIAKVDVFKTLPSTVLPLFWIEEGVNLNNTFTKPIKDLFMIMKIVNIAKWVILVGSLVGLLTGGYMQFKQTGESDITPVKPVDDKGSISTLNGHGFGGHVNHAMSDNDIEKY